jgi:hypothetical protein
MPPEETKSRKKRTYHFELSIGSMFFWGLGLAFILAWIFVLGILVGRGFLPAGVNTLLELKTQIAKLQDMVSRKDSSGSVPIGKMDKEPKFAFHDELASPRKEKPGRKDQSGVNKRSGKPKTEDQKKQPPIRGLYTVQIASLDDGPKAAMMAKQLAERGYPAYSYKVIIKGKTYYRVRCGPVKDKVEAHDLLSLLAKRERIKGFVTEVEK